MLGWALYALSTRPAIVAKMKEEISNVLGNKRAISMEDLDKMVYCHAVVKESLRYFPPVPWIVRCAKEEDEISGYKIPAGVRHLLCFLVDRFSDLVIP